MDDTWWVQPGQLNSEQKHAVNDLTDTDSYFVSGPPGSGKTNLLVLRAKYLTRSANKNLLLLVFNRTLEEFIASCPAAYRLPREQIRTSQRFFSRLIYEHGGTPSKSHQFNDARHENCKILTHLLNKENSHFQYDVLLLDEAQDFIKEEIDLFFRLAKVVFAAGDFRQSIYSAADGLVELQARAQPVALTLHYRNGHEICRLADHIGCTWDQYIPLFPTSQYDEKQYKSSVVPTKCQSAAQQSELLLASLDTQLAAYPGQLIGVIAPTNEELNAILPVLRKSRHSRHLMQQSSNQDGSRHLVFEASRKVCVTTLHGAKGLEFRAANIINAERIQAHRESQKRASYTAITRAKTGLRIFSCNTMPDYLRAACQKMSTPQPAITVESLFEDDE
ncbi:UvrD-helicase domain-containing protein [Planctomicrobium piriforme]|uniref:DNA 3'-5' helicase II n=1 Tax=Planctomicrobium piriforme TaxID=1576369 RepID=A0A1I3P6M4_9PLAN|nr:UvrD-helicase domain-containing protein [Planctomicrobium piriforme]SFJ17059.1 UvrD/REP helicase N-terminal domain-containing protein [Planctomicrobium piriforme]